MRTLKIMRDFFAEVRISEPEVASSQLLLSYLSLCIPAVEYWPLLLHLKTFQGQMGKKSLRRGLSPVWRFCDGRSPDLPEQHQAPLNGRGGSEGGDEGIRCQSKASQPVSLGSSELVPPLAPGTASYSGCMLMSVHTDEGWNKNKSLSFDLSSSVAITSGSLMELHNSLNKILARIY